MRKLLPLLFVLFILFIPAVQIAGAIEYPVLTEHITDNAGIINAEYRQKIGDLLDRIEKNTTAEVAVLTIKSLEGEDKATYATEVGQKSGIGKKDTDNGLLLLIAMDDGQGNGKGAYFVATGYGLEGTLPDATVLKINEEVLLPYLKKGKETGDNTYYGQGIYAEMLVFEGLLSNNSEIVSKYGTSSSSGGSGGLEWIIIIIIVVIFAIVILVLAIGGGGGGGGGGGYSSGGYSSGGGGGEGGSSSGGFGGGGFGGGGAGGGFKRATGTVAISNSSSSLNRSNSYGSSSRRSSSHTSSFGGGGFGGGGFGGGRFGGGGSGGGF